MLMDAMDCETGTSETTVLPSSPKVRPVVFSVTQRVMYSSFSSSAHSPPAAASAALAASMGS